LRYGREEWEPAEMFWDQPDRNEHTSSMFRDTDGTLFHFNGYSVAATWGPMAVIQRKSTDHGRTWSKAKVILPEHNRRQMPIETTFRTQDGQILLPCDAVTGGAGGTAVYLSADNGETWRDTLGTIAGIHACVTQLKDGRLMAFGRGDNIDGKMPISISSDMGRTWEYSASIFPPSGGCKRPLILRLKEGPLLFVSFTSREKISITDQSGRKREVSGMFAGLSYDEGKTWPKIRLVSHDGPVTTHESMDGRKFKLGFDSAEPRGYNSICQGDNGVIHLITSRQHYRFNLKWIETPAPSKPATSGQSSKATKPDPANGATGVSPDTKLSWTGAAGALFDVYFGQKNPPAFKVTQKETSYNPGPLEFDTEYFWQIDTVDGSKGNIWSFRTFWYGQPDGEEMNVKIPSREMNG
jgi:hypothetical protein